MINYFDTHAHYDDEKFKNDRDDVINKIYQEGVTKCVNIGCSIETSIKSIEIASKYDFVYASCGIHPSEISNTEELIKKDVNKIKEIILNGKKVVAIGEIGLDYHYDGFDSNLQKLAFELQIKLANELSLPIIIHTRDAIDDTINIIRNCSFENGAILHCCPFNKELIKHGLENGLYIAFGGTSTFKNSKNACDIINMVPNDKILIETDSPYLAPDPIRGTRNDSSNLKYIVEKIAEFKGKTPNEIANLTYKNAEKIFRL